MSDTIDKLLDVLSRLVGDMSITFFKVQKESKDVKRM